MRKQRVKLVGVDGKPSLSSVHLGFAAVPGSEESLHNHGVGSVTHKWLLQLTRSHPALELAPHLHESCISWVTC